MLELYGSLRRDALDRARVGKTICIVARFLARVYEDGRNNLEQFVVMHVITVYCMLELLYNGVERIAMQSNNFWGRARPSGVNKGVIARLSLALVAIVGGLALTFVLMNGHAAHASSVNTTPTIDHPVGVAIDGTGNVWVAEPNCNPAPTCINPPNGAIEEFNLQGGTPHLVHTYQAPIGVNPTYLKLDGSGQHVWFTDPTNNQIGELTITGAVWTEYTTGISTNAQPYDLVLDQNGNIWFAERAFATGATAAIGFFNTTTKGAVVETHVPTAGSGPFGMTFDATNHVVWFAEDNAPKIGTFAVPATIGAAPTITEHSIAVAGQTSPPNPHMITYDGAGHLWYSEQGSDLIGEYTVATNTPKNYNVAGSICPTPGVTPTPCSNTFISGIALDSTGNVWFDEVQGALLGSLNPTTGTVNLFALPGGSGPGEGLAVDATNNVWVSMLYGYQLGELPAGSLPTPTPTGTTPTPTSTGTPPPTLPPGPVSQTWYFAEGHIGQGFQEYLTIQNPDTVNSCFVQIQYLLSTGPAPAKTVTINPNTRWTENVDQDLGIQRNGSTAEDVSTILTVMNASNCKGVVAERPMYFTNVFGVSSGHDALGATHLGSSFYFPDVASYTGYRDFITILNPPGASNAASVTVTYYVGGTTEPLQSTATVPAGTRYTITPPNFTNQHVSAFVSSTQPIAVERPAYFNKFIAGNAGTVSGASVAVGATGASNDWRFAEGYVGPGFQEYLQLANFSATAVSANAVLEYDNGSTLSVPVTINGLSTTQLDVNYLTTHPSLGTCAPTPCNLSLNVSVEIKATTGTFVAERQLYFHYSHNANGRSLGSTGGSDILGQSGAAAVSSYSFAEGYTNGGYDEWLTLQNPTSSSETIWVTLVNGNGAVYEFSVIVGAQSRGTVDLVKTVLQNMCNPGAPSACWEISMTVQTLNNGGAFVAERPMYFNASGTQGGTDVLGYAGG